MILQKESIVNYGCACNLKEGDTIGLIDQNHFDYFVRTSSTRKILNESFTPRIESLHNLQFQSSR